MTGALPSTPKIALPAEPPSLAESIDLFIGKLNNWLELAIANLPNLIAAVIAFVLFLFLSRIVRKIANKVISKTPVPAPIRHLLVTILGLFIVIAGLFVALGLLGLDKTVASLLAGVGILGLALGFAFQDIAANFMAGVVISFRRPFAKGDVIETGDIKGVVDEISLRTTILHRFTGEEVRVPNTDIINRPLTNYTVRKAIRVDIPVGVAYGDDLDGARKAVYKALESIEGRLEDRGVGVFYNEFGGSSINFIAFFWIPFSAQIDLVKAKSEAIISIKKALDDGGFTIPFPIRTLDFGVVGGEPLKEHLEAMKVEE